MLGGTLRLTWVTDHLAHALRHSDSEAGETSGTWTGLACPWPANYPVLELMQGSGLTQFSPAKPQRW